MSRLSKLLIIIAVFLAIVIGYSYAVAATGPVAPLGRASFVKFMNPDFYPGHPHSQLLAKYAEDRGSQCALVVHFAGSSNYKSYQEGNTYIIEMGFVDSAGAKEDIDWGQAMQYFLFGVPDNKWTYRVNGIEFKNYDDAMNEVKTEAQEHGQVGPIPMVWHGSARAGSPIINPGCGFPLYYYICWKQYGRFAAYYYAVSGMIFPYISDPFARYELTNAQTLQQAYTSGRLNYTVLTTSEKQAINKSLTYPTIFPSVYQEIVSKPETAQAPVTTFD